MANTKSVLLEHIQSLSVPAIEKEGMELVDVQFVHEHGQWVLRFFLDKPGGITLDDCAMMSDRIGNILDAADAIPQAYSLEVSSPGVYRPLKTESDFRRYHGQRADITLYAPVNGRRHIKGTIAGVETGAVIIEEDAQNRFTLALRDVAKATLDPDLEI